MTDIAEPKQDKRGHVTMGAGPHDLIHPAERPLRRLFLANRAWIGTLGVFAVMMAIFIVANPRVFSNWGL
jgi:simple sugar transport system permease protein